VYCSVISKIGMSVIDTWLTRMRCRRRSKGPAKAAMEIGGRARSMESSVMGPPCHPEPPQAARDLTAQRSS